MGYADGYYYGQGRIICDTSTFSVGDTIRVRSMTDSSKVWNQQVATVGTALVFTVPCYDYYKICTVQTINDTPTEIGGVYKTVDYGQTLFINLLEKDTLAYIQSVLDSHTENYALNIGDEVTIKINEGGTPKDWIMQIGAIDLYDSHEVLFVSKHIYSNSPTYYDYSNSNLRTAMQNFYSMIVYNDKQFIKQTTKSATAVTSYDDYVYCLGNKEVTNGNGVASQIQYPIFLTQANRIKTYQGTASTWWTADYTGSGANVYMINVSGNSEGNTQTNSRGVVPCFRLTADS